MKLGNVKYCKQTHLTMIDLRRIADDIAFVASIQDIRIGADFGIFYLNSFWITCESIWRFVFCIFKTWKNVQFCARSIIMQNISLIDVQTKKLSASQKRDRFVGQVGPGCADPTRIASWVEYGIHSNDASSISFRRIERVVLTKFFLRRIVVETSSFQDHREQDVLPGHTAPSS